MSRRKGLDFVRALSAIGIIAFHFYCHTQGSDLLFYAHANGAWGGVLNYLFFILSGFVLHSKYGKVEKLNLGEFYYKRWKAMMPAYLIVFAYAFSMNVFTYGKFFYMDIPNSRFLLTLIGMDGYFSWITTTYFITGEWFLGAILIAYVAYPLLRYLQEKREYLVLAGLAAAYAVIFKVDFFGIPQAVNPATCILSFYIGMMLASHPELLDNIGMVIAAALLAVILLVVPVPGGNITKEILIGLSLLISLNKVGERICKSDRIYKGVFFVSSMSYYTFLLHHRIIYKVLEGFDSVGTRASVGVLIMIILVTLTLSQVLSVVMKSIFRSGFYRRIEDTLTKSLKTVEMRE